MPKITKYEQDSSVTTGDKLIGTDTTGSTKNFSIESLSNYFAENAGVYKHNQNSATTEWEIEHNLDLEDYLPAVTVKMSGGVIYPNIQGMGLVTYVDKDNLKINFISAESGHAYIKK